MAVMAVNLQPLESTQAAARDVSALKQVFETIDPESCPRSYNFHMHTIASDGKLRPQELIEQAVANGLQGLAITDHHSVNGYLQASCWLQEWKQWYQDRCQYPIPHLWTGVEINADLLNTDVHILGYAFDPKHPSLQPYLQGSGAKGDAAKADNVIGAIQAAGGLAVLAHPARYRRSPEDLIHEAARLGIDGVETYYAYDNPNPWRPSPKQTQLMQKLSAFYGLLSTCGTDTHGRSLLTRL
jgi:predicted metal-dependent phosphoesterase TrpH